MKICPSGAIYRTAEGAVAYDRDKCIGCKLCVTACPFDVPRYDADNKMAKCHLCFDRIGAGMQPACVKTCPTGALKFGDRDELIGTAKKEGFKTIYGEKDLGGLGSVYAFKDEPKLYGMKENPAIPSSVVFWHNYSEAAFGDRSGRRGCRSGDPLSGHWPPQGKERGGVIWLRW